MGRVERLIEELLKELNEDKQSSDEMSSLAARVLAGYAPTKDEIESMAACILTQDETKGKRNRR